MFLLSNFYTRTFVATLTPPWSTISPTRFTIFGLMGCENFHPGKGTIYDRVRRALESAKENARFYFKAYVFVSHLVVLPR